MQPSKPFKLQGVGLGLRKEFIDELQTIIPRPVDFLEIAPENWMDVGGRRAKKLQFYAKHYPMVCHGLSLSLGGPKPLDTVFIAELKKFLDSLGCVLYSEHLSYSGDTLGHLYDLLPLPYQTDAIEHVVSRIQTVQQLLNRPLVIENISYYCTPNQTMTELAFIKTILQQSNAQLLLDVNNVFVNSFNHGYCPFEFIRELPTQSIAYCHIAGHEAYDNETFVDTHGAEVKQDVWELLRYTYQQHGLQPTLLERDFNVPPLSELLSETHQIRAIQTNMHQVTHA